jgi:hypothetical protein
VIGWIQFGCVQTQAGICKNVDVSDASELWQLVRCKKGERTARREFDRASERDREAGLLLPLIQLNHCFRSIASMLFVYLRRDSFHLIFAN